MKTLILAAIRCSLMFLVTGSLFSVQPAQAFTITLEQIGANVVANGSGAFNLTGLSLLGSTPASTVAINPAVGYLLTGPPSGGAIDVWGTGTGPTAFGIGGVAFPSSGSGDLVGVLGNIGRIVVPQGYVSGAALSDTMTFNNETLASLGLTPGTYVWSWGTGLPNQNFTLIIEGAGVPDTGTTVSLLGFALLGLAAMRRKLSC